MIVFLLDFHFVLVSLWISEPLSDYEGKKYKNVWASVLFLCNVAGIFAVGVSISAYLYPFVFVFISKGCKPQDSC